MEGKKECISKDVKRQVSDGENRKSNVMKKFVKSNLKKFMPFWKRILLKLRENKSVVGTFH